MYMPCPRGRAERGIDVKKKDNWIRQYMDENNISIKELAEILNLSERTVRGYYKGWNEPGRKVALNIMKVFDMDLEEQEI